MLLQYSNFASMMSSSAFVSFVLWLCFLHYPTQGFLPSNLPQRNDVGCKQKPRNLCASSDDNDPYQRKDGGSTPEKLFSLITSSPKRSVIFSILMAASGACLGPFLDSFHSLFGVLDYNTPITVQLWGEADNPALITSWWVPELFGLAGFLIGWLYLLFDAALYEKPLSPPSPPKICLGISFFTFQYWLSGVLFQSGVDRTTILNVMSVSAVVGFAGLDCTLSGFITSAATAIGGPLIEVGLLKLTIGGLFADGYHYTDPGETGFFPLWIVPVYFLGGPANGNLARGYWSWLSAMEPESKKDTVTNHCDVCGSTRCVPCPNW